MESDGETDADNLEHYLEMPGQTAPREYSVTVLPSAAITSVSSLKPTQTTSLDMTVALLRIAVGNHPNASHYVFNPSTNKDPVPFPTVDGVDFCPPPLFTVFINEIDDIAYPLAKFNDKELRGGYNWWQDPGRGFDQSTDKPRDGMHRHSGTVFLSNQHARLLLEEITDIRKTDFIKWSRTGTSKTGPHMLDYAIHPLLEAAGVGNKIQHAYYSDLTSDPRFEIYPANTYPVLTVSKEQQYSVITPLDHEDWPSTYAINTGYTSTHGAASETCEIFDIFPWAPTASAWAADQEDAVGSWSLIKVYSKKESRCKLYALPFAFGTFEARADTTYKTPKPAGVTPDDTELFGEPPINDAPSSKLTIIDVYCAYNPYLNIKSRFINTRLHRAHSTSHSKNADDLITFNECTGKYTANQAIDAGTSLACMTTRLHSMASYAHTQRASAASAVHYNVRPSRSFLLRPATHNSPNFDPEMPLFEMECELPKWSSDGKVRETTTADILGPDKTTERRFRRYEVYYDTFNAQQQVPLFGIKKTDDIAKSNCIAFAVDTPDTSMCDRHTYVSLGKSGNTLPRFHPYDKSSEELPQFAPGLKQKEELNAKNKYDNVNPPNRFQYKAEFPEYTPPAGMPRPSAHLLVTKLITKGEELFLPNDKTVKRIATHVELNTDMIYATGKAEGGGDLTWAGSANPNAILASADQANQNILPTSDQRRYVCYTEEYIPTEIAYSIEQVTDKTICLVSSASDHNSTSFPELVFAEFKDEAFGPAQQHSVGTTPTLLTYDSDNIPDHAQEDTGYYRTQKDPAKGCGLFAARSYTTGDVIFAEQLNVFDGTQKDAYIASIEASYGLKDSGTYIVLQTRSGGNKIVALFDKDQKPSKLYFLNHPSPTEDVTCELNTTHATDTGAVTIAVTVRRNRIHPHVQTTKHAQRN